MKIIKDGYANQTPCCMMNKACSGHLCPAWEPVTGGGICGMVPRHHHAIVEATLSGKDTVSQPQTATNKEEIQIKHGRRSKN